jgi:hypothetical protein
MIQPSKIVSHAYRQHHSKLAMPGRKSRGIWRHRKAHVVEEGRIRVQTGTTGEEPPAPGHWNVEVEPKRASSSK